ncbi:hypothetical protein E2C01_100929 [Portunus trituberculatus]|uniref:Uncharacterized protein n=1 Tax=Portunus trituberculatus TaxID=210409 RepID=A0A5B7KIS3_PORTR|nr:hypothetical protein [Portunus trituberculatus]
MQTRPSRAVERGPDTRGSQCPSLPVPARAPVCVQDAYLGLLPLVLPADRNARSHDEIQLAILWTRLNSFSTMTHFPIHLATLWCFYTASETYVEIKIVRTVAINLLTSINPL